MTLLARQLTLAYDKQQIISGLNLALPAGQVTTLVGPNGCGKSTILKGLARLLKPHHGSVLLDGKEIHDLSTREVAKRLGVLSQRPTAPEGVTVKELVAQGRYPHQQWWQQWSRLDEQMTQQALATTGLQDLATRPLEHLSGGQRQRAWIALVLAQDTPLLLLDEPTTFLDIAHQIEVLDLLRSLNRQQGRTIVLVLHDLNQACRYSDHLVAIRQGQILAQGSPSEVVTVEMVRDVFDLECQIYPDPITHTPMCIPIGRTKRSQESEGLAMDLE